MSGIPLTNYHVRKLKFYSIICVSVIFLVLLIITIVTGFMKDRIVVNEKNYALKNGFPLFTSQEAYISLLKKYPYDCGTSLQFHTVKKNETLWGIAYRHGIHIDTIIAANPFITSLLVQEGTEIALPSEDGILVACDDMFDAGRMAEFLDKEDAILGDYTQSIFEIFALDDIRFVFFSNTKPVIVNKHLEGLYKIKHAFQTPTKGRYTSFYGMRIDPFLHCPAFHDGVDIMARIGTPIYPVREGIVSFVGWKQGYGKTIKVMHPEGYISLYGHCSEIMVDKGTHVSPKTIIALVGSTGRSTGPHLHISIMQHGKWFNPLYFIW